MTSPRELFEQNLDLIDRICTTVCRRNGCTGADAEDFVSRVKVKLLEDGCARLASFKGESSLPTYINTIVVHQFLDYRDHLWGKWRPSAAARRLGPEATVMEQLVHRDGLSADEAFEVLQTNHHVGLGQGELREIWQKLPHRTRRHVESIESKLDLQAEARSDDHLLEGERVAAGRKAATALRKALKALDAEDYLLLKLRFKSERTVAAIARSLGKNQRALYSRLETLFRRLKQALENLGLNADEAMESIGWDGWDGLFQDEDEDEEETQ